ncbi:hypothetical protein GGX14DRAFT_562947 [Mycena pura]|uniref:Uncharacterized protein n=1 Tax=Mycena pura TaxID=153505 RepID=A0AAD6VJP2_9AGAR|nr:hypothetical protein GGX14DRAFT_562947 [Mycena pura]
MSTSLTALALGFFLVYSAIGEATMLPQCGLGCTRESPTKLGSGSANSLHRLGPPGLSIRGTSDAELDRINGPAGHLIPPLLSVAVLPTPVTMQPPPPKPPPSPLTPAPPTPAPPPNTGVPAIPPHFSAAPIPPRVSISDILFTRHSTDSESEPSDSSRGTPTSPSTQAAAEGPGVRPSASGADPKSSSSTDPSTSLSAGASEGPSLSVVQSSALSTAPASIASAAPSTSPSASALTGAAEGAMVHLMGMAGAVIGVGMWVL